MIDNEQLKGLIKQLIFTDIVASQTYFASKLGYERSTISGMVSGKKTITNSFANKVCEIFGVNIDWLRSGKGEMLKDGDAGADIRPAHTIRYWVDVDATAGGVQLFDDLVSSSHIDISIPEFRDCTDAVNLYGDSMLPLYKSGQIIILKEWKESFIDFGNVYLIITKEGNRMVKYLRKGADDDHLLCISENKDFDPFDIKISDVLKLFLVKGSISKNTL